MSSLPIRSPRVARGYTVVEVLLAMTVLIIGASGVMSMEKASMQGNLDARKTDVATNIARMWMDRIEKDAMSWTLPSPSVAGSSNYGNALLLNHVTGNWFLPTDYLPAVAPLASISPGFDILGRDVATVGALPKAVFCVHLRETWLANNSASPTDSLLRVELRVVWPRGISTSTYAPPLCDSTSVTTVNPDPSLYSTLYMVTAVRANGLQ
jgi:type II secretory pathway pseudopilin PulG